MVHINCKKRLLSAHGSMDLSADFSVSPGEFVSFFGPSGSGKTSILRMIAGLMNPDEGFIEIDGETWFDSLKKFNLVPQKRRVGFVFQDYALFPHMTVRENIRFACEAKNDFSFVDELLRVIHLKELENELPLKLSGGQKQRVALARALARKPKILLLDEPFSALDMEMRIQLQREVLDIYERFKTTTVFVSHDVSEVFKMSKRIFILEDGKIVRSGLPQEIFIENNLSGKFKFIGKIVDIVKDGFLNILVVQVDNNLIRVVATDDEARGLNIGNNVIVASKAFNPIIMKY